MSLLSIIFLFPLLLPSFSLITFYGKGGEEMTVLNQDLRFRRSFYNLTSQVLHLNISQGCLISENVNWTQSIALVDWNDASQAGCTYYSDVVDLFRSPQVLALVLVIDIDVKNHEMEYPAVYGYLRSQEHILAVPFPLTSVFEGDAAELLSVVSPFQAHISNETSFETIFLTSTSLITTWVFFAAFTLQLIYVLVLLGLQLKINQFKFNLRVFMLISFVWCDLAQLVSDAIDPIFSTMVPVAVEYFLFYIGPLGVYCSLTAILVSWVEITKFSVGSKTKVLYTVIKWITIFSCLFILVALLVVLFVEFLADGSSIEELEIALIVTILILILIISGFYLYFGFALLVVIKKGKSEEGGDAIKKLTLFMIACVCTFLLCITFILLGTVLTTVEGYYANIVVQTSIAFFFVGFVSFIYSDGTLVKNAQNSNVFYTGTREMAPKGNFETIQAGTTLLSQRL